MFNASSSEMYKGHIDYHVKDNDTNMLHLHPYSIAKTMGHSIVEFYRTVHNMPFSNGVIFTTESSRKSPEFLLNKVALHANQWSTNNTKANKTAPLTLGNLDSSRNILHAFDVANAIHTIMESTSRADTYLICNNYTAKVKDLVVMIYSKFGIILKENAKGFYDKINGQQVIIIKKEAATSTGYDNRPINITGEPTKLFTLNWMPTISLNEILDEIVQHAKQ
jgi:GDP-D-mannose dehydratase